MYSEGGDAVDKDCSVRVAVRIRPQNSRELIDMCRICTTVTANEPQILLGSDKAFTFDYVYDINSNQSDIYAECVERLVKGTLHGYNATVLAYGQTGSGKTYTMGTGFDHTVSDLQLGIIPRAIRHIFDGIEAMQDPHNEENTSGGVTNPQFSVAVQFIELYNEDIVDLLDPFNQNRNFKIHESGNGQISVAGATIKPISEPQDALKYLQQGALARTTASTKMNDQSSRSHALFTIFVRRQHVLASENNVTDNDLETLTSKFHFVDLAGSERLKRTLATGDRAREGISINCGLLALGNCISALGDKSKRASHVPYRDSKLTRLLQDSLGGNSQTLMIACVSPSDRDFMETLNTLKYANRARNIKNKVQINQDQSSRTISQYRREIAALQLELLEYKQGIRVTDGQGNNSFSDTFYENTMLLSDNKRMQQRLKAMQETVNVVTERNVQLKLEKQMHNWAVNGGSDTEMNSIVEGYIREVEQLQAKLIESEAMYQQKQYSAANSPRANKTAYNEEPDDIINMAKKGLEKDRELLMSRSLPGVQNPNLPLEDVDTSGSDSESDAEGDEVQADLNEINSNIEIKTKLIEQLELSQQRMQRMRQQYEDKLAVLNCKISNTQKERDEVLSNMTSSSVPSKDNLKKVKVEYERKITDMQRELKRLQNAQREHIRQQRELKAQEVKLNNLRMELSELKCTKVKLMNKITEQMSRHREEDTKKTREIAQLRKEQRRQKNAVLSLQAKMNAKDQILRRKTEEVSALRKSQRGLLSRRAGGQLTTNKDKFASLKARASQKRWDSLHRLVVGAATNKQYITQLERELDRLITEREELGHQLQRVQESRHMDKASEDSNEEDNLKTNIRYVQENIEHVQQAIMVSEDSKDSTQNALKIQNLLDTVSSVEEAKYLLQKFSDNAISLSCSSAMSESLLQEHVALLRETQQEISIKQQLFNHFLLQNSNTNVQISELFDSFSLSFNGNFNSLNRSGSQKSLISNGTYDIPQEDAFTQPSAHAEMPLPKSRSSSPATNIENSADKSPKVRRRTARRHDLLFGDSDTPLQTDAMTRSYTQHEPLIHHSIPLMRVPSAPGSLKHSFQATAGQKTDTAAIKSNPLVQSPRLGRRSLSNKATSGFIEQTRYIQQQDDYDNNTNDVFSRLGAGIQNPISNADPFK